MLLILLMLTCVAVSMLLSGMEAGVFALNRLRVRQQMRTGNPRAKLLYRFLSSPEDFLWTILVGNTVANVIIFTLVVRQLYQWLWPWPWLLIPTLAVSVLLFYAVCELGPKMLFRTHPNRLCMIAALPFRTVHLFLRPLVAPIAWMAGSWVRWSGGRRFTGSLFGSREELRLLMQESGKALSSDERVMINRVLELQKIKVGQIAIPMEKVISVSVDAPIGEVLALGRERGLSRLPAWRIENGQRRFVGLVTLPSLLYQGNLDEQRNVKDYLRPAMFLDSELRLESALRQMQRTGHRLALVLAPDRTEVGIISLQDILQVIFGAVSL